MFPIDQRTVYLSPVFPLALATGPSAAEPDLVGGGSLSEDVTIGEAYGSSTAVGSRLFYSLNVLSTLT